MKRTPLLEGTIDWKILMEQTDADLTRPDVEYEFSNGRKFYEQRPGGSPYDPAHTHPHAP